VHRGSKGKNGALFLASDDAAWISGAQIVVDGGALAATT
jgi:NAD(P)-dependent dehydrogenase (short-subunit alcohol dehydrogenase family)